MANAVGTSTTATGITGTTNATGTKTVTDAASDKARKQLSGDFDTFMTLLTTQLKNQDPVEPLDTHEFTAQLVQFANVEQNIATNTNLEKMIQMDRNAEMSTSVNYIGKFIQAKGDSARLQDGVATFTYSLPKDAYSAEVVITDKLGSIVYKGNGPTEAGKNEILWDGTSNITGKTMPEGTYHIKVVAKDAKLETIEPETYSTGFVSAVDIEGGNVKLLIGDVELDIEDVLAVRNPSDFANGNDTTEKSGS